MADAQPLSQDEEEILTSVGYLVMRWNYAEYFMRQIIRQYLTGISILDSDHIKLSKTKPKDLVKRLNEDILPKWQAPGQKYLKCLIEVFAAGRDHRNNIVHGIRMTIHGHEERPAYAILMPNEPFEGKLDLGSYVELSTIRSLADYFHDLAMFAREIGIAFGSDGSLAYNQDGSLANPVLPDLISVLPPIERILIGKDEI